MFFKSRAYALRKSDTEVAAEVFLKFAQSFKHPEMALLVRSGIYIAVPDGGGELPEVPIWCSFLHVAAVEPTATGSVKS